jgi:hypothetical protein
MNKNINVIGKYDQMILIINALGPQLDDDLSFLTNDAMVDYTKKLNKSITTKRDFKNMLPGNSDLMTSVLD